MGAWQSSRKKIKRLRPPGCRDLCRANTARIDHEALTKRLVELENDDDHSEIVSVEKETIETPRRTLEINGSTLRITYNDDHRDLKEFLDENLCKSDYGRCNEKAPHLHGYLNGMPIVLKLPNPTEESPARDGRVVSFKKEPKFLPLSSNRDASSKDQDNSVPSSEASTSKTSVEGKTRACDVGGGNKSESKVDRQTSPMTRIRSASTSPCSISKECLKSENYSFPGSSCTRDRECAEKCATGDLPVGEEYKKTGSNDRVEIPSLNSNSQNKRKGGNKKSKTKWKPWAPAEPLPDTSSIPRHSRYGSIAYALTDEEPKPTSTFRGENTTNKEENRSDDKTKVNRTQDITTTGFAMKSERSPFRQADSGRKKSKDDSEYREYLTYLMLLDQSKGKNLARPDSTSDVLHSSRIYRDDPVPRLSKYAFLFESGKESIEKSFMGQFCDWENVCEPNYFAVPVQVPQVFDKLRKNSEDSDEDIRNEQTLIIARTPPPRSNGTLLMGAKTVITVRENALVRRYSDNCGAEESEVAPSEGQKSGKWLKKPGLPLVIISRDSTHPSESHGSLNKSKRPKRSVKTNQPKLPIFQLRDRLGRSKPRESASEISQTDKSSDDETSRRLNLSDDHDSGEDLCQAEIATRHCGERKRNPHRWSRASKKRKVKKQTGSKESIKKSYKDRFRTFFARKSRQSFKKIRKILNRVTLSGRSSKKDIGNCVSGRSSTFTHLNYPVMVSSKVTCTSESNDSFFEIEPRASPTEEIIPPVVKTCATSCATETEAYIEKGKALSCKSDDESQPCECLDNRGKSETESLALCECPRGGPCDGMKIKKKCSVFLCCIESTSPPAKIDRKRRRKKKKRKSRNKGSQLIKMD